MEPLDDYNKLGAAIADLIFESPCDTHACISVLVQLLANAVAAAAKPNHERDAAIAIAETFVRTAATVCMARYAGDEGPIGRLSPASSRTH